MVYELALERREEGLGGTVVEADPVAPIDWVTPSRSHNSRYSPLVYCPGQPRSECNTAPSTCPPQVATVISSAEATSGMRRWSATPQPMTRAGQPVDHRGQEQPALAGSDAGDVAGPCDIRRRRVEVYGPPDAWPPGRLVDVGVSPPAGARPGGGLDSKASQGSNRLVRVFD